MKIDKNGLARERVKVHTTYYKPRGGWKHAYNCTHAGSSTGPETICSKTVMVDVTQAWLWLSPVELRGRAQDGAHSLSSGEHWDDAEAGSVILRIGPRISV